MIRGRLRRLRSEEGHEEDQYIEIESGELSRLFAAPIASAIVRVSADLSRARAEDAA
jgi:hypothetical protein